MARCFTVIAFVQKRKEGARFYSNDADNQMYNRYIISAAYLGCT